MTVKTFLLTREEFSKAENERMALATQRNDGKGASIREILPAGAMWEVPWYFDPQDRVDMAMRRRRALERIESGENTRDYLSKFYWQDWSEKRPPLCVLCPGGGEWCIDARSSNGEGWQVTGTAPLVTCTPSILLPNYHGFLTDGVFTPDLDAATRGSPT